MGILEKVVRALRSGRPVGALVRLLNRSQLRHLLKWVAVLRNPANKMSRVKAARGLDLDRSLVEKRRSLSQNGYVRFSDEVDQVLLSDLQEYASDRAARLKEFELNPSDRRKDFWVYLSDQDMAGSGLTTDHILVRFALQERVLRLVASYFGEVPYLTYVLLTYSRHSDDALKISQLWHKDYDDTKILKLFTYLSDVSEIESGPFTFLDRTTSRRVRSPFFLRHLEDKKVLGDVGERSAIQMAAPAQTSFIVDTGACYHMGSRVAPNHSRLMYTALYTSYPTIFPDAKENNIAVSGQVTPLQRMALQVRTGSETGA